MNKWVLIIIVAGILLILVLAWFSAGYLVKSILNRQMDAMVRRLFTEPYTSNLWEGLHAVRRFGPEFVVENELRAHTGLPLMKPIGSARPFPHFDGLLFTPAQLHRHPVSESASVNVATTLGPCAERPLTLAMPIMVTAMGYGVALSKPFVHALAKGTANVGTAFNSGQGPILPEYRELAHRLIMQYHGGFWRPTDEDLLQADMIEIRFGQGANAGNATFVHAEDLSEEAKRDFGIGQELTGEMKIPAGLPGVLRSQDLRRVVSRLRDVGKGVPIAVKIAAGNDIELDLKMALHAEVDVIVVDGAQAGTHGSPAILVDDFGLPTLAALCRAVHFLEQSKMANEVDVVVSGGLRTPGDILKALALGAKAVNIGNAALFATMHEQIVKALPFEPPTQLAWENGSLHSQFDEDVGADSLSKYLTSCAEEIKLGIRALGKSTLAEVNRQDLVAWDVDVARITGVPLI